MQIGNSAQKPNLPNIKKHPNVNSVKEAIHPGYIFYHFLLEIYGSN